ncbi:MAG: 50S ribosomal protein L7/L12 [Candidatus Babeliales bacterium]
MSAKTYDKLIEEVSKLTLMELNELVKQLETTFGVSAAMPTAAAGAGSAAPAAAKAEEKNEFKVTLKDGGPVKINTIKALRAVTTLGLGEAKAAVENAPTVIGEAVAKDKAMEMKQKLEEAGAKVELS